MSSQCKSEASQASRARQSNCQRLRLSGKRAHPSFKGPTVIRKHVGIVMQPKLGIATLDRECTR